MCLRVAVSVSRWSRRQIWGLTRWQHKGMPSTKRTLVRSLTTHVMAAARRSFAVSPRLEFCPGTQEFKEMRSGFFRRGQVIGKWSLIHERCYGANVPW